MCAADCDCDAGSTDRRAWQQISCAAALYLRNSRRGLMLSWCVFFCLSQLYFLHLLLLLLQHLFSGLLSRTAWISRYQKGKTCLDLNEARDDGVWDGSGISWTVCKQPAPRSRRRTTPTPHHSIFTGRMLFLTPNQQFQSTKGFFSLTFTEMCVVSVFVQIGNLRDTF